MASNRSFCFRVADCDSSYLSTLIGEVKAYTSRLGRLEMRVDTLLDVVKDFKGVVEGSSFSASCWLLVLTFIWIICICLMAFAILRRIRMVEAKFKHNSPPPYMPVCDTTL